MKILLIERHGLFLDLVMELENDGHKVVWYIGNPSERDVGLGLVDAERPEQWTPEVKSADAVVFLDNGYGQQVEMLKKSGKNVVGGTKVTDKLVGDKVFLEKFAKSVGVEMTNDVPEISIGAWFNGHRWVKPAFLYKSYIGLMGEFRGPLIPMGCYAKAYERHALFGKILKRFAIILRSSGFVGLFSAHISNDRLFSVTTTIDETLMGLHIMLMREQWGNFLLKLASGSTKSLKVMSRWAAGINTWTLPAPLGGLTDAFKGMEVKIPDFRYFHPVSIAKVKDKYVMAGTSGFTGTALGHAITLPVAIERARKVEKDIIVPLKMSRLEVK